MTSLDTGGRINQKRRTYNTILQAAAELVRTGRAVTMPEVAKAALVSEATAYRYFPDLTTLLQKAMAEQETDPAEALAEAGDSTDPVERVAAVTGYLMRHVARFQQPVRTTIAATITDPADAVATRRGLRFELIDLALEPWAATLAGDHPVLAQLKRDLAITMAAESLFCLTDQCGLPTEEAITSIVHTASTLTRAAVREIQD